MRIAVIISSIAIAGAGCGDDGGGPVDAAPDAEIVDASVDSGPDAFERCPGQVSFTGEYVDWDSTPQSFSGIAGALIARADMPAVNDTTSPNGRWELCVASGVDLEFDFTEVDHLSLIYTMDAEVNQTVLPTVRGLTPARAATLFSDELSLTRDPADAQVMVDVRDGNGEPLTGTTVTLGASHDGATSFGSTEFFANVVVPGGNAGTTTVAVTSPGSQTCVGPDTIAIEADRLAATTFVCD